MQALVGYDSESDNDEAEEEMMQEMKQQTIDDEETRRVKQQKLDEVEGEATASATEQPVAISPPPPQQQPLMTSSSSYSTFPDESLANRLLRPLGGLESSLELPPEPDTLDCDIPGLQASNYLSLSLSLSYCLFALKIGLLYFLRRRLPNGML